MPFTLVITEAAHKYGLDHYSSATNAQDPFKLGTVLSYETSFGDNPRVGDTGTISIYYTGGYTTNVVARLNSTTSATITTLSLVKRDTGETLHHISGSLSVSTSFLSSPTDSTVFAGADTINGNSFNNILQGWAGNDRFNGGAGVDTVVLQGLRSQYTVTRSGDTLTTSGPDGTDTLTSVERIQFNDARLAFDTAGNGGQAYRLYQAAFNRTPDQPGLGYQMKALDDGQSLKSVAQNFLASPEFSRTYGSLDNNAFITRLYENVLHRAPDTGGLAYHRSALDAGGVDRAQLLVNFSESPENQAALIGTIQGGMVYTLT
jgi:hypothetical protein